MHVPALDISKKEFTNTHHSFYEWGIWPLIVFPLSKDAHCSMSSVVGKGPVYTVKHIYNEVLGTSEFTS